MKTKSSETKPKRYSVFTNEIEHLNTANHEEAQNKIHKLQAAFEPVITLIDHKEKRAVDFKKTQHQKNYRITEGIYVANNTVES